MKDFTMRRKENVVEMGIKTFTSGSSVQNGYVPPGC
jgi:hypothetical protein